MAAKPKASKPTSESEPEPSSGKRSTSAKSTNSKAQPKAGKSLPATKCAPSTASPKPSTAKPKAPRKAAAPAGSPGRKASRPAPASASKKAAAAADAHLARLDRIKAALALDWPDADSELDSHNPFEMLCATILAAQCTDKRVNEIAPLLFAEFPDAPALANADPERVKTIIHPTGFFNNKTKSLIGMAKALVEKHGGEVPRTLDELTALPGVGRKTAWCVLGRYFGVHGIIVDTHMTRVSERLGFHTESDPVKIEMIMNDLVPEAERTIVSHRITLHGRYVCQARKPQCHKCSIRQWCPSASITEAD